MPSSKYSHQPECSDELPGICDSSQVLQNGLSAYFVMALAPDRCTANWSWRPVKSQYVDPTSQTHLDSEAATKDWPFANPLGREFKKCVEFANLITGGLLKYSARFKAKVQALWRVLLIGFQDSYFWVPRAPADTIDLFRDTIVDFNDKNRRKEKKNSQHYRVDEHTDAHMYVCRVKSRG